MLHQVQCRVTSDNPFCCTRSNVELPSTAPFLYQVHCRITLDSPPVPGPVSSHTRQPFLLYQVQCRVTLDSPFFCTRSTVELHSTALLYQVQCRVTFYSLFFCTRSNVELVIWCNMFYVVLSSRDLMAGLEIRISLDFLEKIWTRLSELTVTSLTAKWRSCWLSQNLHAERGNEECAILYFRNQFKYPRTQCR
jgi:hypothetical protein